MNAFRRFFGRDDGEEGQAVVLFAILMLALLFAVGLAIDAGQLYSAKRAEQEAADAAAFAGAVVIYQQGTGSDAISAARTDALTNGYSSGGSCLLTTPGPCTDAATQTTVTVNWRRHARHFVLRLERLPVHAVGRPSLRAVLTRETVVFARLFFLAIVLSPRNEPHDRRNAIVGQTATILFDFYWLE